MLLGARLSPIAPCWVRMEMGFFEFQAQIPDTLYIYIYVYTYTYVYIYIHIYTYIALIIWLDQTLMKHNKDYRIIVASSPWMLTTLTPAECSVHGSGLFIDLLRNLCNFPTAVSKQSISCSICKLKSYLPKVESALPIFAILSTLPLVNLRSYLIQQ